jgi:hypothetical protein
MEGATPARLYATSVGAILVILGIAGFFYTSSFGTPGEVDDVFGIFAANGWANVFHIAAGAVGLLVAGYAAQQYALLLGVAATAIAIWGFALGPGEAILSLVPVNTANNVFHLVVGGLGILAVRATGAEPGGRVEPARSSSP